MKKIWPEKENKKMQKSKTELEELKAEIEELKLQVKSLAKELDKQKSLQKNSSKELDKKIRTCNDWVKDTRERLWSTSSRIQKCNEWIKDTRDRIWPMSSNIATLQKGMKDVGASIKTLEYKQKRYCPEEKYELAISDWYREKTGMDIDIKHPKTFTQLVQWAKIHENTEIKSRLSDKYAVREWIKEKIGEQYLIPMLGVYERAEDIDFDALPEQFVLKCNHGCAYNIIVKDKSQLDREEACHKLNQWLKEDFVFKNGMELHYSRIEPRIIAEKYMIEEGMDDLPDYKFFCFGGQVFCSFTIDNIKEKHSDGRLGIFDRDYNLMPYGRKDFKRITEQLEKPQNYDKMVELAEILSEGFSHVRVDFYNINGAIYFGEMTFTTGSGIGLFEPDEFDRILGEQWLKYLPEFQ